MCGEESGERAGATGGGGRMWGERGTREREGELAFRDLYKKFNLGDVAMPIVHLLS